jgi:hypothetical protein
MFMQIFFVLVCGAEGTIGTGFMAAVLFSLMSGVYSLFQPVQLAAINML